ncbi:glyoxalase superfamily protein [Verrucomicrobium spinosum]|uniref:glyoxalase superfamily protein n=1 Tax=Verrucomicrobium spinosum TaxID=2736 RepID=UPI000B26B174|nr:glyoxalase superfamily protein [Verrucomicrobium spinosum]
MSPPNLLSASPLLHVSSSEVAEIYYGTQLGFTLAWQYRPHAPAADPGYLGFERDGVRLHVSSFSGDGVAGGVASFEVRDVDASTRSSKPGESPSSSSPRSIVGQSRNVPSRCRWEFDSFYPTGVMNAS